MILPQLGEARRIEVPALLRVLGIVIIKIAGTIIGFLKVKKYSL